MTNFMHWRYVFTMVLGLKLRVWMMNTYDRWVDALEGRAGPEGLDGTTGGG
jgi:hypothetical protein